MSDGDWPVELRGVTESVTTTLGPNGRWNAAALGIHAGDPVTARTWGHTRTRRNFEREGRGYVQFTRDPFLFVEAALGIHEANDPVLDAAEAWADVAVERVGTGADGDTAWVEWTLVPLTTGIETRSVPTINRGFNAVVEATVAASRLAVPAFERARLETRLSHYRDVVETCGGERERAAFDRLVELTTWNPETGRDGNESF